MMSQFDILQETLGVKHLNPDGKRKERRIKRLNSWKIRDSKNPREKFIELKNLLKGLGYKIIKVERQSAHTIRNKRIVALEKTPELRRGSNTPRYHNQLYTLAHETGHVLQWDNVTNIKNLSNFFFNRIYQSSNEEAEKFLQTIFYELDAWEKGEQFIPKELLDGYYNDARWAIGTYMRNKPIDVNLDDYDFLKPLLDKFLR